MLARQALAKSYRTLLRHVPRVGGSQTRLLEAFSTKAENAEHDGNKIKQVGAVLVAALAGGLTAGTVALAESIDNGKPSKSQFYSIAAENNPPKRPDLPTIPLEEVAEHNEEGDMWYTFRGAVYDMSFFLNGHPGGAPVRYKRHEILPSFDCHLITPPYPFISRFNQRLMMAAGQDLEPYWDVYRQHFRGQ